MNQPQKDGAATLMGILGVFFLAALLLIFSWVLHYAFQPSQPAPVTSTPVATSTVDAVTFHDVKYHADFGATSTVACPDDDHLIQLTGSDGCFLLCLSSAQEAWWKTNESSTNE